MTFFNLVYSYWFLILFYSPLIVSGLNLRHEFWYIKWKDEIKNPTNNVFETKNWNYCDLKCFYLQNYHNYDFVFISFKQQAYRPDFAACYIRDINSPSQYTVWNNKIKNKFYQQVCGMDMQDYLESPEQYEIIQIEGQGRQFTTNLIKESSNQYQLT